ncbi:MAG: RidA family protein [Verrucomicrobiota bacterium]
MIALELRELRNPKETAEVAVHQGIVYLSGQVAEGSESDSVYEQTKKILRRIDLLLKHVKSDKSKILKVDVSLSDIQTFPEMNYAWKEWIPLGCAPARAVIETRLAHHHSCSVEMTVMAVVN